MQQSKNSTYQSLSDLRTTITNNKGKESIVGVNFNSTVAGEFNIVYNNKSKFLDGPDQSMSQ